MFIEIEYKLGTGVIQRMILNTQLILEITKDENGLAVVATNEATYNLTERYVHLIDRLGINIVEFKK